jgi:hypothetical protein
MRRILTLFAGILLSTFLFAAISAESNQRFTNENGESLEDNGKWVKVKKESVKRLKNNFPEWFYRCPLSNTDEIYSIGISDPGLPENQARVQALQRAGIVGGLLSNSTADVISENRDGRFTSSCKIQSYEQKQRVLVLDSFKTKYDEMVYLTRIATGDAKSTMSTCVETEMYSKGDSTFSRVELQARSGNEALGYLSQRSSSLNKRFTQAQTTEGESIVPLKSSKYSYKNVEVETLLERNDVMESLNKGEVGEFGLWYGFVMALCHGLSELSSRNLSHLESLQENNSNGTASDRLKSVSEHTLSCQIKSIALTNNYITLQLQNKAIKE